MRDAIDALILLQSTSGAIAKKKIITQYKDNQNFRKLLYYALHPLLSYNLSEKTLRRPMPFAYKSETEYANIFELCEYLSKQKALHDATVISVKTFLNQCAFTEREIYIQLLSKTLRLGVTSKTVNQVIPGLLPEWEVQQAYPIDKYPVKDGTWFALTEKLNGVRATYFRGNLYARSGDIYRGLDHIIDELERFGDLGLVFDGELTLLDKGGLSDNEAFRTVTGIINSESDDKTRVCFRIFDVIPDDEFAEGQSEHGYRYRREELDSFARSVMFKDAKYIHVLELLYQGTDLSKIDELLDLMVREDKEGLMVNLDVPYKCKRHNGILKVKRFYTMDLPILRCEEGSGRLSGTLGAFVLDYDGNEVNVGTGFSDEDRAKYWAKREDLTGTLCEVKYKEISSDKRSGAKSLQFPVYVCLRTDKTEPSFA